MLPRLITAILALGAALWLLEEDKNPPQKLPPKPLPSVSETPIQTEMSKVMRHLGKRSGKVRGGKV